MNFTLRKLTTGTISFNSNEVNYYFFSFCKREIFAEVRTFHRWVRPTLMELKRRKDKMGEVETNRRSTFLEWLVFSRLIFFLKKF